ncbi:MAG: PQQ-binding-like beta-propeller repeat protein [Thermoplasmata archaeon]
MKIRNEFAVDFILFMVLTSLTIVQGTSSEAAWPNLGNDLQNSSRSTSDTSHLDGTLLWKLDTEVSNYGGGFRRIGPVIDEEGMIYFGSGNPVGIPIDGEYEGALFAVNPNGSIEWKLDINRTTQPFRREMKIYSPAIGSDGVIYCVGSELHSVSRQGELRWSSYQAALGLTSYAISFEEGVFVFTGGLQNLLNFVSDSGEPLWNFTFYTEGDEEIEHSHVRPAIDSEGTIYMGVDAFNATTFRDRKGYLYAINEGQQIWRQELASEVNSVVLGDDENIYVGCDGGELYAFDKNGVERWTYDHTDSIITLSMGIDDTIYSTSNNGTLMAFGSDGELKWNLNLHNETDIFASLAVGSEGTVYAGSWHEESEHAELYAVSSDGTVLWNHTLDSMPVGGAIGSEGTLYILSKEGVLYAFGGEKIDRSWQTFLIVGIVIIGASVAVYLLFKNQRRTQQHRDESRQRGDLESEKRV